VKNLLLFILILWGIPSTYFRSKFRKIIYETNDWKINIKPLFRKELKGLFSKISSKNKDYIKTRNNYRIYLIIYGMLFLVYSLIA
jgi:peroxiredoxin Q/BCP|tara:strand:- start:53 stop:307 length:255 start_codon:yes stop_codon:yes gene_type:complete